MSDIIEDYIEAIKDKLNNIFKDYFVFNPYINIGWEDNIVYYTIYTNDMASKDFFDLVYKNNLKFCEIRMENDQIKMGFIVGKLEITITPELKHNKKSFFKYLTEKDKV